MLPNDKDKPRKHADPSNSNNRKDAFLKDEDAPFQFSPTEGVTPRVADDANAAEDEVSLREVVSPAEVQISVSAVPAPPPPSTTAAAVRATPLSFREEKEEVDKAASSPLGIVAGGFGSHHDDKHTTDAEGSGSPGLEKGFGGGGGNGSGDGDDDGVADDLGTHAMTFGDIQGTEPTPTAYDPTIKWWALALENVFNLVDVQDPLSGLSTDECPGHAKDLGDNLIPIRGGPKWYWILCRQFLNAVTVILLIIVVISAVFKDWAEFGVVLAILFFNAALGFYQEFGAEKSMQSLKQMTAGVAKVMRNGVPEIIFIDEVVVGDVIILEQGASVPADCRVFESSNLEVDEALLTGEALPVQKHANVIPDSGGRCALGDRKNMVFRNTLVTQGRGKAVVTTGGLHTEMGKLAKRLGEGGGDSKTALMKKLDWMMYFLFGCCIILAIVVFGANKMQYDPTTLSYATAVAIAILPESLFLVITVAMTMSVKKMAQQKCIVRKLTVLEVLGNVTDICSDKTGTLTENKMVVKKALIGVDEMYTVTGAPYDVHGLFVPILDSGVEGEGFEMATRYLENRYMYEFLRASALCSTTILRPSEEDQDTLEGSGNPTEVAIQVMTWKAQLNRDKLAAEGFECCAEYAFDSGIKRMSAAWHNPKTQDLFICTKGAPERVLQLCNWKLDARGNRAELTREGKARVLAHIDALAQQGLRTICLAYRAEGVDRFPVPTDEPFGDHYERDTIETDLVYLGVVGIYDPPRPESRPSVIACQHAGITVRMLTGDHTSTAGSIASMLNIIGRRELDNPVKLQAGPDFDSVAPEVVDGWAELPLVIGRCSPESKVKMIESLHRRKKVVAMTGDGFNDSPSIKISDVGCAMGSGVDVTKGVADLIITDDNFSTIVKAVAEGRRVSQCIRKFVVHLLSSNVAEVIALICGLWIRNEGVALFVLSPLEILWLNLLTSSPPATGLSMDKPTEDILSVPPNTAGFFTPELICDTFIYGFWLGAATLGGFVLILYGFGDGPQGTDCNSPRGHSDCFPSWQARCCAFGILYFGLFVHAYTVRHPRISVFRMKWFDNKWLYLSIIGGTVVFFPVVYINPIAHNVFVHHMLTWHWGVLAVAVIFFLCMCELYKVAKNIFFPLRKIVVEDSDDVPEEEADMDDSERAEARQREYRTFTHTGGDDRSATEIAEENLRMSFVSYAESVGTAGTSSFRVPDSRRRKEEDNKKKRRSLFGRGRK